MLEKELYGAAASHYNLLGGWPMAFLKSSTGFWNQASASFEVDLRVAGFAQRGMSSCRWMPDESDPTKADPHDLSETQISRDIPGQERGNDEEDPKTQKKKPVIKVPPGQANPARRFRQPGDGR